MKLSTPPPFDAPIRQTPSEDSLATTVGTAAQAPGEPTDPASEGAGFPDPTMFLVIGALFWFLILGPERKQRKKRQALLDGLSKGDEVMTTGGILGRVSRVSETEVTLVVADGVRMRFSRGAVQGLQNEPKDSDKKDEEQDTAPEKAGKTGD